MKNKVIQRKWAFVLAIIFLIVAIKSLMTGFDLSNPYGMGQLFGTIFFPALFFYIAFKKKK